MIRRKSKVLSLIFSVFILCGCNNTITTTNKDEDITIFPARSETWVGDPIGLTPLFWTNSIKIFVFLSISYLFNHV